MIEIEFSQSELSPSENKVVAEGFQKHSEESKAPAYEKEPLKWIGTSKSREIEAVMSAELLWDWIYIDELWVRSNLRRKGYGRKLMHLAEEFGQFRGIQGIWLWTQSWQAANFYIHLGYQEFTRFENFPSGHSRIGFRKSLQDHSVPEG